jgi:hypothetical protein
VAVKSVNVKIGRTALSQSEFPVGKALIYQCTIWRVMGLYFTAAPSGGRELWWILGVQQNDGREPDGEEGVQ